MKITNPFAKPATQTNLSGGSDSAAVTQTSQNSVSGQSNAGVDKQISALVPGQTLQGEVVSKNGKEVTIKLADDMLINARLERELNLELGKLLTFQVKNNGKMLSLSPLFANMSTESTAGKALDMANIPFTDRTLQMASRMMEKGMQVDIDSIQNVYKDVAMFGDASVEHILRLHQMNIPVTAENIHQLIQYENLEHQLNMGFAQVVSDLQAEGLDQTVLGQIMTNETVQGQVRDCPLTYILEEQDLISLANSLKSIVVVSDSPQIEGFILQPQSAEMSVKDMLTFLSHFRASNMAADDTEGQVLQNQNEIPPANEPAGIFTGTNTVKSNLLASDYVATTALILDSADDIAQIKDLLAGPLVNKMLCAHLANQWSLMPEQAAEKQNVREMYERLSEQLDGLKQALESTKGEHSVALKSVNTLQNNLSFMNHLNQMYTYIQIPLMLNGKHTQGELYVYSNNRSLAREDGAVSALLHLDMEHLGPVDVYVSMQNQNVNTNFYLETDELLDFIYDHIYILDEHLAKRGYSLHAKMQVREENSKGKCGMDVIGQIMQEEPETMVLSRYAFDVRA